MVSPDQAEQNVLAYQLGVAIEAENTEDRLTFLEDAITTLLDRIGGLEDEVMGLRGRLIALEHPSGTPE